MPSIKQLNEKVRNLTNASLSSIISGINTNFNFIVKSFSQFLTRIDYNEDTNAMSLNEIVANEVRVNEKIELGPVGEPALIVIDSDGRIEGQSAAFDTLTAKQIRFEDYATDLEESGTPSQIVYVPADADIAEGHYAYYSDRGWVRLGEVDSGSGGGATVTFDSDLLVNISTSKSLGKYVNGDVIPATGKTIQEVMLDIVTETVHPNYVAPIATLASSVSTSTLYEVGGTINNVVLDGTFNQNNGGGVTSLAVQLNGSTISTSEPYSVSSIQFTTTPKVYRIIYNYAQGNIINNNLGQADPIGRILAGSVTSNTLSYRGYYKIFYGPSGTVNTTQNSGTVRALPNSIFSTTSITGLVLNTGSSDTIFRFWLPSDRTLISVIDLDALNLNITTEYVTTSMIVNDMGGTGVNGTLYTKIQSVPYATSHRHNITIQ